MRELLKRLNYDSETGEFIWIDGRNAGKVAGYIDKQGYRVINFKGKKYKQHRLVWLLHYNELDGVIDHINRSRSDNRLENLRLCSQSMNMSNQFRISVWPTGKTRYASYFKHERKVVYLGTYDCPFEAGLAVVRAKRELGCLPVVR